MSKKPPTTIASDQTMDNFKKQNNRRSYYEENDWLMKLMPVVKPEPLDPLGGFLKILRLPLRQSYSPQSAPKKNITVKTVSEPNINHNEKTIDTNTVDDKTSPTYALPPKSKDALVNIKRFTTPQLSESVINNKQQIKKRPKQKSKSRLNTTAITSSASRLKVKRVKFALSAPNSRSTLPAAALHSKNCHSKISIPKNFQVKSILKAKQIIVTRKNPITQVVAQKLKRVPQDAAAEARAAAVDKLRQQYTRVPHRQETAQNLRSVGGSNSGGGGSNSGSGNNRNTSGTIVIGNSKASVSKSRSSQKIANLRIRSVSKTIIAARSAAFRKRLENLKMEKNNEKEKEEKDKEKKSKVLAVEETKLPVQKKQRQNGGESGNDSPNSDDSIAKKQETTTTTKPKNGNDKIRIKVPKINSRKRKLNEDSNASSNDAAAANAGPSTSAPATTTEDDKDKDQDDKDAKKKKNRCAECRKKVGLTGFECRCGGLYCAVHRYSDKHDCTFNYREHGAQEIRRNNPVVVGEKIQKI